jgi:hypothetical protein
MPPFPHSKWKAASQTFTNLLLLLGFLNMPSVSVLAWISQYAKYALQSSVTILSETRTSTEKSQAIF